MHPGHRDAPRMPSPHQSVISLLTRRVWLPRWLYAAVPWLYLVLGATSLISALAAPEPAWVVPLAGLAGLVLLHLGLWIATVRYRRRHGRSHPGALLDLPRSS
jgi:hypothetical protein